jgi:hypothetical protein
MSSWHEDDKFMSTSSLHFHWLTAGSDVPIVEMNKIQVIWDNALCQLEVTKFFEASSASIFWVKQPKKAVFLHCLIL